MENNYLLLQVVLLDSHHDSCGVANIPILPYADSTFLFQVARQRFNFIFDGYDWYMYLVPCDARDWRLYNDSDMTYFLVQSHKILAFHRLTDYLMSKDFQKSPFLNSRQLGRNRSSLCSHVIDNIDSLF